MISPLLLSGFACAVALAYAFTWLARLVAPIFGYVDKPDGGRKRHHHAVPLLGGLAVFTAFLCALSVALVLFTEESPAHLVVQLAPLVASSALFCAVGLWDDKLPLRARDKFLLQILASLPYAIWGHPVEAVHVIGFHFQLGPWALLFSVFWLVSCANVVNLVDGLDGLASSVGLIAIGTLAIVSLGDGASVIALVALTFAGSITGFLIHNWPPARIFLGDAGSLTIGFMIGALAIETSHKTTAGFVLAFPLALLSVPILDTSMAILRRKLTGRGIGEADRGHIHHRLQDRGLTKLQTLLALVGLCSTMAIACLLAMHFNQDLIAVVICGGVVAFLIAGRIFGFQEMMLVFRHFEIMHLAVSEAYRDMNIRRVLVHLEHADSLSLDALWETTLTHVQLVGGLSLELTCTNEHNGENIVRLDWKCLAKDIDNVGTWQLTYAVPRADGLTICFRATGDADARGTSQSLTQVTQVLEACCRQLAVTVERRQWLELATGNMRLQHEYAGESELQSAEHRRAA